MNITEKKLENSSVELQIEVPVEQVEIEYKNTFVKLQKAVKIDGFRKGKAPMQLVETRFIEQADKDVAENLVKSVIIDALSQKQLTPIAQPHYYYEKIKHGEPFSFKAVFEVPPTVNIGKYKDIQVEEKTVTIKDSDIEDEINAVRERDAKTSKKEDGVVQNGDFVKIKVRRTDEPKDGKPADTSFKDYSIIVGKSKDSSALDKYIVGMKSGEEREVDVKYPKDYNIKDLAGEKVTYIVKVEEVNNFELPELNDEYAKKHQFESVAEMKKKIKENVEKFVAERIRGDAKAKILQTIIESSTYDIPETMINTEMVMIFRRTQERLGYYAESVEKFAQIFGIDKEEFIKKLRDEAEQSTKTALTLKEIANKEQFKVDEEKYKEVVSLLAARNNKTPEELETAITENNGRSRIENELILDQAMDFIYEHAKIKKLKGIAYSEFVQGAS